MKTYAIHKTLHGFTAVPVREGTSPGSLPVIQSATTPARDQCAAAWEHFVPQPRSVSRVPQMISSWQARAALRLTPNNAGGTLLDSVEALISAMPDGEEKVIVTSAWENNAGFARNSPTIRSFASQLGLTEDQVDALFVLGAGLVV